MFSNVYVTKSLQGYSRKMSLLSGRYSQKMRFLYAVLWYTIKRSFAKLIIKHRMSCNKPIAYKKFTKFFPYIFALLCGKEVTPIYWGIGCAIFRPLWNIKIFGSIFSLQLTFWSDCHGTLNCILFLKYGKVYWC